MASVTCCW